MGLRLPASLVCTAPPDVQQMRVSANGEKISKNKKKQLRKKAKKNQERIEKEMASLQRMDLKQEEDEEDEEPMSPLTTEANASNGTDKNLDTSADFKRKELQYMVSSTREIRFSREKRIQSTAFFRLT